MKTYSYLAAGRRRFLKGAVLGTAGALASASWTARLLAPGSAYAAEAAAAGSGAAASGGGVQTVMTAAHWGALLLKVQDGKIIGSEAALPNDVPNELTTVTADYVHAESRVKYPMVRRGFLDNPGVPDTGLRGRDEWVRVSWDTALDLITKELQRVREAHGLEGVFAGSYGWKSSGVLHSSRTLLHRFMNLTGGFVGTRGDYSTGAAQVIMPHVMGTIEVYEQQTSWEVVHESTELVVLWGANPLSTLRIAWTATDRGGIANFKKLKESGKRIVCIDPVRSESCDFLGAEWIPLHTATDVPLMLAMAHTLISDDKHDKAFLQRYTVGFDRFADYVMGRGDDATAKTPAWASAICGVPADTIMQLARDMAAKRTMIMGGWGPQRQRHGEQAHWMMVTLAAMLGQIGLPGGGFGFSYHYSDGGVPTAHGGKIGALAATVGGGSAANTGQSWLQKTSAQSFPLARIADVLQNPGKKIQFNGQELTYPDIKLIYWAGGNPFVHHQDTNQLVRAWQKLEVVIVNEIFWTPTARMADIVLPVTSSYERNDLTMSSDYSGMRILPMKKAIEPQFEAKSDLEIFTELARRFGVEQAFTEGKTEMEWLRGFYQVAFDTARANRVLMPKFDEFWQANQPVDFTPTDKAARWVRYADFREDPLLNPLGTPSGKIEIFSKKIEAMGYDDCRPYPSWLEPEEWAGNATAEAPLALVTPHPYYRLHSQLANTSLRDKYAVAGREPALIHSEDAAARGIADGDVVRVFNQRGQVLAGAVVTDGIIKGTLCIHQGAWYDPADPDTPGSLCKNGNVNVLAMDVGTSQLAQGNSPNTGHVQVEKYTGTPPEVTVFKEPAYSES